MGIKGLKRLIADNAPDSITEKQLTDLFGTTIAIDASMFLYSFLVAIRTGGDAYNLTDANGDTTSHLQGIFNRTIRLLECGIKPVYVFDGKPPEMKADELKKRRGRKQVAQEHLNDAQEIGDQESVAKLVKQTVKVTREHNEESKKLLRLLGVPVVEAPSEAESQCAEMCKLGLVEAAATEDMDCLTAGAPILLRHLTLSEAKKIPIHEISLPRALADLKFEMDQFIDLCILLGCDYCGTIRGIGPKRALELIRKHKNIEGVLANLDKTKYPPPDPFPFQEARLLFQQPEVSSEKVELKWKDPDLEGLIEYLVGEKNFSEQRVRTAIARAQKGKGKRSQGRINSFFPSAPSATKPQTKKPKASLVGQKRTRTTGSTLKTNPKKKIKSK